MTELQCFFAANIFLLRIFVNAAEVIAADGRQVWTHKDGGASAATGGLKPDSRNVISPRMDFDEWTPLGRGDPLKNDPTFDYLPPVLDKVHYWKSPPPPPPPPPSNRAQYPSTVASSSSHAVVNYNRRFFLTDFSKKEPAVYAQYTYKRPQIVPVAAGGYHYPVPKTPLPMLTPPPYQRPTTSQQYTTSTVEPTDASSFSDVAGNSAAESKQPPTVRAPPPPPPPPPLPVSSTRHTTSAPQTSSVRPVLSHSIIKVLLENEVDRTAATTIAATTTTTTSTTTASTTASTTSTSTSTTRAPPTTDPLFAHYKQSAVTGRPMYLIIQGHSKVKTYGLVSKPDDLSSAADRPVPAAAAAHEHNHIGNRPDEPNRRKRDGQR